MSKAFDLSKFRKSITKSIDGLSVGFHDPKTWISTGNYCLNYLISKDFKKGIPLGRVCVFAGSSGSGKSLIVSGNVVKNAQDLGIFVVLIDSENALDESWLQAFGVDTSEEKLLKCNMAMIDDVGKLISTFVKDYRAIPEGDRPQVLFVIDSLGMLLTPTMVQQFDEGGMKGDMGIKAKQLKALITNCVNILGDLDIGMVVTNHTYAAQDKYSDDTISGGSSQIFAASIVVQTKLMKLKEDEDGNKVTDVLGIRSGCKVIKSRYNKPFETMEISIPYSSGINPYSGLFDLFEKKGIIKKDGNRYTYTDKAGSEHKHWRKEYLKNTNGILDLIMGEFEDAPDPTDLSIMDENAEDVNEE
jgi:recombination protein RecA